ncbi:MAG: hypothetical protein MJZ64_02550 [Paludibacteraceae bacterium]|nr:hypothetical protein [Paludibacteraceae bacterium]
MKKLSILAIAAILCCLISCKNEDSTSSFNPKSAVTILDQIMDLTTNEAINKIKKSGLSLWQEFPEYGTYYFANKSQNQIIFIESKNGKVIEAAFGEDEVSKEKANSVMKSWINQIGKCYEGEHKFEFEEVSNQSTTSTSYSRIEEVMESASYLFTVNYIGGIRVQIHAEPDSEEAYEAKTYDYYNINMSRDIYQ